MRGWKKLGVGRGDAMQSLRAAVGTSASLLIARQLKLPQFYWAPISTIVILLSTTNPLSLAWQRFVGTALGAVLGAVIATYFSANWAVYGIGIFVCGILSTLLKIGVAYRFAAITLSIVLLSAHNASPSSVAFHRFIEVSLGIAVALLTTLLWPVPKTQP
jgi:uncharacterized membrane protein YgaE (UPF0421/DUF939 family)